MLNLISDAWIPVRRKDGSRVVIAPWQMADDSLAFPDWPRPDLNIACLELLIGLVFLADPPSGGRDWRARQTPDPERLRDRLAPFAPAFELMGEGPRFMQDFEKLEELPHKLVVAPASRLFIDSGGENTEKNNADLFVKRDRYGALDPATAAMALFTTQIYAYADSSKHMASLRGNGPLVTLVEPLDDGASAGLWPLVWANVPNGLPADPAAKDLPWLRSTVVSGEGGGTVPWPGKHVPETFFSMPWRVRLIAEDGMITGFVRKDFGTQYGTESVADTKGEGNKKKKTKGAGWLHPLTPYRRRKPTEPLQPVKAPGGTFFFTNWLGTVVKEGGGGEEDARAECLRSRSERSDKAFDMLVAGWAMDKAKPADFVFARVPEIRVNDNLVEALAGMISAAKPVADALIKELVACLPIPHGKKPDDFISLNAIRDRFFHEAQDRLESRIAELTAVNADPQAVARGWLDDLKGIALALFKSVAEPLLAEARIAPATINRDGKPQRVRGAGDIVGAWRRLENTFRGYGGSGQKAFQALGLEVPERGEAKKRRKSA
ncbi:MAG: type I-E CRISPR-associated protein Cse1/CasA [Tabrizicola sp.]